MTSPPILISAGEASGEMYAAQLATALRWRTGARLFGLGGPRMREAGVDLVADSGEFAVVGISEVVRKLPAAWRTLRRLTRESAARRPALAILVDFPDFNLRLGRKLREQGVRIVYFISPQVWAWRPKRVHLIKELVERVLVIFPFEEQFYRGHGVPVNFVGHPLLDSVRATATRAEFIAQHDLDPKRALVVLLPGSRPGEIAHNLPTVLEACEELEKKLGSAALQFVIAAAPGYRLKDLEAYLQGQPHVRVVERATYNALAAADCAIVSSGTATVEAGLLGAPMVVVYRVSRTTAFIARRLVRTPFISMVNLILGRGVVRELIQDDFTPQALAAETQRLLQSAAAREQMKRDLGELRARLGPAGAIERTAEIISGML